MRTKAVWWTLEAVVVASLLSVAGTTRVAENLWLSMTGRGYVVPKEASLFSFRPLVMNEGSGEWWLYGEDGKNYYAQDDKSYVVLSKEDAARRPGFVSTDRQTWGWKGE